mgnify:FL=1
MTPDLGAGADPARSVAVGSDQPRESRTPMTHARPRAWRRLLVAVASLLSITLAVDAPAGAARHPAPSRSRATVVLDGLSSPRGLTAALGIVPIVGQGAFGPPGPVVMAVGRHSVDLTGPRSVVDVALAGDGGLWMLESNTGQLYRRTIFGRISHVADLPAYQAVDIDPDDNEGIPEESNPYGLAALPNGDALVADAAGNDVLRVSRTGRIRTVARFTREMVATDHIPGWEGPPALPTESVPTSIAVTRSAIYVGELKGFPFRPGSSHVYKLPLDAIDATCDATAPNRDCRVVESGLTAITDIAVDPWTGALYVYELAADGVLAFEAGFETGAFPPAVLLELKGGQRRELAAGQLSQPGGVTASLGVIHVTDGVFTSGRLLRIHR